MFKLIKSIYLDYALNLDNVVAQFDKTAKKLDRAVKHSEIKCACAEAEIRAAEYKHNQANLQAARATRLLFKFKELVE